MVLNGAAVLEAIFLPASEAGQYPRIARGGEVVLERGQPAMPRTAAVLPSLWDVDLRPRSLVITDPMAAGSHPHCWRVLPALVGPHICPLSGPLHWPEAPWGGGMAFAALQSITPLEEVGWPWCGVTHVTKNCDVGSISSSATNFPFSFLEQITQNSLSLILPLCKMELSALSSWEWSLNRTLLRKFCRGQVGWVQDSIKV